LEVGIASRWGGALEQNHEKDRMMDGTMKDNIYQSINSRELVRRINWIKSRKLI
jgi:hypothetical protein